MPSQIGHHDKRPIHISRSHSKHPAFSNIFSNSLYYPSLYRNEDEKISSSTNSSSSRPRVERSSSTRIANAAKLLRQHLRRDSNAATSATITTSASNSELHRHKGRSQSFSGGKEEIKRKKIQRRDTEMKMSNSSSKAAIVDWPTRR